jgi:hypothetical protein
MPRSTSTSPTVVRHAPDLQAVDRARVELDLQGLHRALTDLQAGGELGQGIGEEARFSARHSGQMSASCVARDAPWD